MGVKEILKKEENDLLKFKKVYETFAFLTLAVLIFQQLFYLVVNIINFVDLGWFTVNNFASANLQAFVGRIVGINSGSVLFMILGILAWFAYYFLLYILVWRFANKQKMAKWTWTLFVAFGPTLFFIPAYVWFILYAFRKPIIGVIKKIAIEYKEHNIEEDIEDEEPIEEEPVVKTTKEDNLEKE